MAGAHTRYASNGLQWELGVLARGGGAGAGCLPWLVIGERHVFCMRADVWLCQAQLTNASCFRDKDKPGSTKPCVSVATSPRVSPTAEQELTDGGVPYNIIAFFSPSSLS